MLVNPCVGTGFALRPHTGAGRRIVASMRIFNHEEVRHVQRNSDRVEVLPGWMVCL